MGFPILLYHEVSDQPSVITTPVQVFQSQMEWIKQVGIEVIPLAEVVARVINHQPLPSNGISLTFDDGLRGVYRHAYPILRNFGFSAVAFIVSDYCGLKNNWPGQPRQFSEMQLMRWEEVQELSMNGFEIGAHSLSHPRLDKLSSKDELEVQIAGSKKEIMERINQPVNYFAYPFGRFNTKVKEVVKNHFIAAFTTFLDLVQQGSDCYLLSRLESYYFLSPASFRLFSSRALPAYVTMRRMLRSIGGYAFNRPWT